MYRTENAYVFSEERVCQRGGGLSDGGTASWSGGDVAAATATVLSGDVALGVHTEDRFERSHRLAHRHVVACCLNEGRHQVDRRV
jgi:hypothetical protein